MRSDAQVPTDSSLGTAKHLASLIRASVPPMHPGGRPIVWGIAAGTVVARSVLRLVRLRGLARWVTRLGFTAAAGSALFFREPARVTPTGEGLVVAPADGLISLIEHAVPPAELGLGSEPLPRVSIFLSVLDVHVQRVPMNGIVSKVAYHRGKFLSADLDKASEDNERNSVAITALSTDPTVAGKQIVVVQIAGLLARRIVCDIAPEDAVAAGRTYGLIRFGSRVDTYFPVGTQLDVKVGQRAVGGETVLARLSGTAHR